MRSIRFLVALAAAVALAAIVVVRLRGEDTPPGTGGTASLVGDSLNVGVEAYLPRALPHWRLLMDDMVGRTTPQGIAELEAGRAALAPYLVVSLGTNDPLDGAEAFRTNVDRVLRIAGPDRCVIWATIWRDGKPNDAFNDVLRDAAEANRRLRLVDWAGLIEGHEELLAPDHLHGNEAGYRQRAQAIAQAVESCAPGPTLGQG